MAVLVAAVVVGGLARPGVAEVGPDVPLGPFPDDAFPAYDLGPLGQPVNVRGRDAGSSGMIGGRSLWAFGDTLLFGPSSDGKLMRTNTGGMNVPGYLPLVEPVDATGSPSTQLVPPTLVEHWYDGTTPPTHRYAIWPSAVIPSGSGGLVFFSSGQMENDRILDHTVHIGIADVDAGSTAARRRPDMLFGPDDCRWSIPFEDADGYLYLYANLTGRNQAFCPDYGALLPTGVARVPKAEAGFRPAYRFWNGVDWVTDPLEAVPVLAMVPGGPSVAWNGALQKYVAVYGFGSSDGHYTTADAPQGPWGPLRKLVTGLPGQNYAWRQHPEHASADDGVILLSYHHPITPYVSELRLMAVDLRPDAGARLADYVTRAYDEHLGIVPDPASRAYWAERLATRTLTLPAFTQALQFSADGHASQVRDLYEIALNRPADEPGVAYWAQWLRGRNPIELTASLLSSAELARAHPSHRGFVSHLYPIAFGRGASAADRTYWGLRLADGMSRRRLVLSLMGSPEAARHQARLAYEDILGRPSTPEEAAFVAADFPRQRSDRARVRMTVMASAEALGAESR